MEKIKYDFNVREEIFGATVLNLKTGERQYISKEELDILLNKKVFPNNIYVDYKNIDFQIKFIPLTDRNINYFSFADISYVEVTRACNLRCVHCLNNSGNKLSNQLSYEELVKLILDYSKNGIQEIRFTGGEPLVYEYIYDLIKLASDNGIYTSIGTNGTLITKSVANKLNEAGLKYAVVSIDGTCEKHNEIRGIGNYEKSINGIKNLEDVGIKTRVNSVIMKSNMEDIIKLAKQFNKEHRHLMIRRFIESGRGETLVDNVMSKNDYDYVKECLKEELANDNYINGHYLRVKTEKISDRIKLPFDISDGCKAGKRAIIITPEGNIHLCGFLAAQGFPPIDNIRDVVEWKDTWKKMNQTSCLGNLKQKLVNYNNIENIQETNCLAYVQNYINRGLL